MKTQENKIKVLSYEPQGDKGFNSKHRKDLLLNEFAALYIYKGQIKCAVVCRIYCTSSNGSNTCALWVHSGRHENKSGWGYENYAHATGSAGGWGYHRPSAAVESAIIRAGFELNASIGGVGDEAIIEALKAIARYTTGKKNIYIHKSNP